MQICIHKFNRTFLCHLVVKLITNKNEWFLSLNEFNPCCIQSCINQLLILTVFSPNTPEFSGNSRDILAFSKYTGIPQFHDNTPK